MAYRIRPKQPYSFMISGSVRFKGCPHVGTDGDEWTCPSADFQSEFSSVEASTPFGSLGISGSFHGVTKWEGWSANGMHPIESYEDTYLLIDWSFSVGTTAIDSGTFRIDVGRQKYCDLGTSEVTGDHYTAWLTPAYDVTIPFSGIFSCDMEGYLRVDPLDYPKARCICVDSEGNEDLCSEIWCNYTLNRDASWLVPQTGFVWLESDEDPTINYTVDIGGAPLQEGTATYENAKLINPVVSTAILWTSHNINSEFWAENEVMATATIGGMNMSEGTYTESEGPYTGYKVSSVGGSSFSIYRRPPMPYPSEDGGYSSTLCNYVGAYGHGYTGYPTFIDNDDPNEGYDCRAADSALEYNSDNDVWEAIADNTVIPGSCDFHGWWDLSLPTAVNGPWLHGCARNPEVGCGRSWAGEKDCVLYDEGSYGLYHKMGHSWVDNPGSLTVPQPQLDDPNPPTGCSSSYAYKDSRMLAKLHFPGLTWNALKISVPANKEICDINSTITPTSDGTELVISSVANVSAWGARFIRVNYTGGTDPITITIDGKEFAGITPTNNLIDTLCPSNHYGSASTRSLTGTIQPMNTIPGRTVPWELGIYKLNTVKFSGLKANTTYHFGTLQMVHKTAAEDGTLTVIVNPEAAWMDHKDPEFGDTVCCDYAGTAANGTKTWWQSCGLVFVDGALAGELVINHFDHKDNMSCGTGGIGTGWRWFCSPIDINDATYRCYSGGGDTFLTTEALPNPAVIGASNDNFMAYLNPGIYSGTWNGTNHELTLSATIRVDELLLPAMWGSESLDLEKACNGLCAVRVIAEDKTYTPRTIHFTSGVGETAQTFDVVTDKWGFGVTKAVSEQPTKSLSQAYTANASVVLNGNTLTASTPIKNRKCSLLTIKGGGTGTLKLRYCAETGKLVLTPNGKLALTCCN